MDSQTALREAFRTLYQTGFGIIDIGARDGLHPMFNGVASLIEAVGFEPDIEECKRLNDNINGATRYRSLKFLPFGLGSADGEGTLHLCRARGNSSLSKPNPSFLNRFPDAGRFNVESELSIPLRSLDGIVGDSAVGLPQCVDFIKIDTQGYELEILRGAKRTLCNQVVAVEVEVEFASLYEGQPLFRDIDVFLSDCGFSLFRLRRFEWVRKTFEQQPRRSAGQLVFGEALYLRDPLSPRLLWTPKDSHQAEALVIISTLYDLNDFALEMISAPRISEMFEAENIRRYVLHRSRKLNRPWRRVHSFLDLLRLLRAAVGRQNRFRQYEPRWSRADSNINSRI